MKILLVIDVFAPKFGGVVNSMYNLSEQLSILGHDVTIITTDLGLDLKYIASMERKGVKVVYFQCKLNLSSFLYSPSMKHWLKENIEDFDIIHLNNFRSYQNYIVSNYAKKAKTPYILQAHGSIETFFQKGILKKIYDFFIGYKILNDVEIVLALTKAESRQYEMMGVPINKIKIIPNGINTNVFDDLNISKGQFRTKYHINDDERIILYLGRINKIKGIDLLVEAFYNLTTELNNVKLVIVGPDEGFMGVLKSLVKKHGIWDKVLFTGPLYDNEKFEAYSDADVYVLPSRYEIFGNTVFEAAACGTPVIVTDHCGISDFVDEFGYVVPFDKYRLEDAIKKVLDHELSTKTKEELLKLLKSRFSLKQVTIDVEKICEEVILEN